jgi:hypothetical protein
MELKKEIKMKIMTACVWLLVELRQASGCCEKDETQRV